MKEFEKVDHTEFSHLRHIGARTWRDWHWQLENSVMHAHELGRYLNVSEDESRMIEYAAARLPMKITPYYACLIARTPSNKPLLRQVIPSAYEELQMRGESKDPLAETANSPCPSIIHRYPDRAVLLVSRSCAVHCRHCMRRRWVHGDSMDVDLEQVNAGVNYIRNAPAIRDVILSGGDPLMLSNTFLGSILTALEKIEHVEIIRIDTRIPVVLPMRINASLSRLFQRSKPIYIITQFNHHAEITEDSRKCAEQLMKAGVPMLNQTVLLKGVNDRPDVLKTLFQKLLMVRILPYYLHQCDGVCGVSHFRTTVDDGLAIMKELCGWTSGLAVPKYAVDLPGGGGKVPLWPEYMDRSEAGLLFTNFQGEKFTYPF